VLVRLSGGWWWFLGQEGGAEKTGGEERRVLMRGFLMGGSTKKRRPFRSWQVAVKGFRSHSGACWVFACSLRELMWVSERTWARAPMCECPAGMRSLGARGTIRELRCLRSLTIWHATLVQTHCSRLGLVEV